jgi:MerR family transcriptional regulator, light-induced transcriptional regulator
MPMIRTNAAAAMLGVSPSTLRSWERRFGFPEPRRTPGGHRQFDLEQVEALRSAFEQTHNVSSAVAVARERGAGPATPERLRAAFGRFDEVEVDRVLEESLAVRSLERTVEEVLLPAVEQLADDGSGGSAEYGFAWRWATGWLAAALRLAPPATRPESVLIFDTGGVCDVDALHAQALELLLRRAGLRTLTLSATTDPTRLSRALQALDPRAVVLSGRGASADACGRLVFAARRIAGDRVAVLDYRGAVPDTGASTVERLGFRPLAARERLLAALQPRAVAAAGDDSGAVERRLHRVGG